MDGLKSTLGQMPRCSSWEPVAGINPKVLEWARLQSGEAIENVAAKLKRSLEEIKSWEDGTAAPTYPQLESLAYRIYKRPVAIFFFPDPPDEPSPRESFRTLPDAEIEDLSADTRFKLRHGRSLQVSLRELNDGENPAASQLRQFRRTTPRPEEAAAANLRNLLQVDIETQKRWRTTEEALARWRAAIEILGIFVFRHSFEQEDVWGFSLDDVSFPIIYLNSSATKTRQIFTLFHETAHLLIHTNGITKEDDSYIDSLRGEARQRELYCNRLAARFLVPTDDLRKEVYDEPTDDEVVRRLARLYKVSPEMLLGRLLDLQRISATKFKAAAARFREEFANLPKPKGGGTYYSNQASYLSDRYTRLAFQRYYQGRISTDQLSDYLGIKVRNLGTFENLVLQRAAR